MLKKLDFFSRKFMITRLSIAFEDFPGSSIASQVMPPCGKIHSKLPIFRVKSVKIYTGQKNLHENSRGFRDKYEVCLVLHQLS